MTLRKVNWLAAACLAALSCPAAVNAQDGGSAGIVRISDGRARTPVRTASFHGHHAVAGAPCDGGCPTCDHPCCHGSHCLFNGWFNERYCKNSPDHGYSPPAKYPLHRRGVQYNAYFPTNWYGTPGASYAAAPMVYQPTDTTQLGFTYQHVPFWQPAPGMMPQRPVPAQWHIVAPPVHASSFHHGYGGYGFAGHGCPCPACQMQMSTPAADTQPAPATPAPAAEPGPTEVKPEASIPPAPRPFENSAASGHIRRAGY